jgi:hypothetical protein
MSVTAKTSLITVLGKSSSVSLVMSCVATKINCSAKRSAVYVFKSQPIFPYGTLFFMDNQPVTFLDGAYACQLP